VKRFGGFSTATFCTEFRIADASGISSSLDEADFSNLSPEPVQNAIEPTKYFSFFGW